MFPRSARTRSTPPQVLFDIVADAQRKHKPKSTRTSAELGVTKKDLWIAKERKHYVSSN